MAMTKKDWYVLDKLLDKATNSELYRIEDIVQKEIRLSDKSISEGFEKRK